LGTPIQALMEMVGDSDDGARGEVGMMDGNIVALGDGGSLGSNVGDGAFGDDVDNRALGEGKEDGASRTDGELGRKGVLKGGAP